ncbi:hypothetical protein B0H14DRAFT_2645601 [Mycena olivaceomarginata]|nr:hypothetical protein B0H14DRAFT_2645601 [Mycena olivaceomarginata]
MALALDLPLQRVGHGTLTEADNMCRLETAVPAVNMLMRSRRTGSSSRPSAPPLSTRPLSPCRSISLLAEWNCVSPAPPPARVQVVYRASSVDAQPPAAARVHANTAAQESGKPKINPNPSAQWTSTTVLASPISAASTSTPELSSETHFESAMQSVEELRTLDECTRARDGFGAQVPARSGRPGAEPHPRRNDLVRCRYTPWLGTHLVLGVLLRPTLDSASLAPAIRRPVQNENRLNALPDAGAPQIASLVAALPGPAAAPPGYVASTQN